MKRLVLISLIALAACSPSAVDLQKDREFACIDSGGVVLWADPSDQRGDTMMIGCIPPEEYAELFDTYTKVEEISDD